MVLKELEKTCNPKIDELVKAVRINIANIFLLLTISVDDDLLIISLGMKVKSGNELGKAS